MTYTTGAWNKCNDSEQHIRITDGCPNQCEYCYAPKKLSFYGIPEIERNQVKIMDMNPLCVDYTLTTFIHELPTELNNKKIYYEFICGVDYRYINETYVNLLKEKNFINIRFAWDRLLTDQYKIKDCLKKFLKVGYRSKDIQVFILSNHPKYSFLLCKMKLDALKTWNVQVSDCWYDNQTWPNVKPIGWTWVECRLFRDLCAIHNQLIRHDGIYPDLKRVERVMKRFELYLKNYTLPLSHNPTQDKDKEVVGR